ncbi:hypothetical protein BTVI_132595 [Pitangus sulphuratus]|nr:hypothetical protein BTVI_132595 [Pitangus sulphuratus]
MSRIQLCSICACIQPPASLMLTLTCWLGSPRPVSTLQTGWDITNQHVTSVAVCGPGLDQNLLFPIQQIVVPKTAHNIQGEAVPVQSRVGQSPPLTGWPDDPQDTVGPPVCQGTADSNSTCHDQESPDRGLKGILSKFANNSKLRRAVDSLKGKEALQTDLDKLERWTITNHMKFNKGKHWILHMRQGNSGCVYRLGNKRLESSTAESDLGGPGSAQEIKQFFTLTLLKSDAKNGSP